MSRTEHLRNAWSRLMASRSFILACHQRADGDCLGAALALARALRSLGKDVVVVSEDGVPDNYAFLPGSESVVKSTHRRDFDAGILIDCEGLKRVGAAAEAVKAAKLHACIDHHIPDNGFGEVRVVDSEASSSAEVVLELLDANELTIDRDAAVLLLAGVIADTGNFKFSNTSAQTLRSAARLVELGARPTEIARLIYESKPLRAMRLLGRALTSLESDESGRVAWARISHRDFLELGATDADTESIVNLVGWVRGPRVAVLFREIEPEVVRISLRSSDGVDVNEIARKFDGGGHAAAAGCTLKMPLCEAERRVLDEVLRWMAS